MSNNEKIDARLAEIKKGIPKLKKENREIASLLCQEFGTTRPRYYWWRASKQSEKIKFLLRTGQEKLSEVFTGNRAELLPLFLGKENAAIFVKILDRMTLYPYQAGQWGCRSLRTKNQTILYLDDAFRLFETFFQATATDCTLQTFFDHYVHVPTDQAEPNYYSDKVADKFSPEANAWRKLFGGQMLAAHLIALGLDEKDAFVTQRVKEIIYGDSSDGVLGTAIIAGALKSRCADAHKMVGDLLLAAKLQEGLRQIILECADEGSLEGFRYIMNLVLENNLNRFSSVIRSFGTWTGLNLAEMKSETVRKVMEVAAVVIGDPKQAEKMFDTDNQIELYVALWGISLNEIDDTHKPLLKLIRSDRKYKRLAGLYFLGQVGNKALEKQVVLDLLDETDLEVWQSLLGIIGSILDAEIAARQIETGLQLELDKKDEEESESDEDISIPQTVDPGGMRLSDREIRRFFRRLVELAESTPKKETRFEPDAYTEVIRRISAGHFIDKAIFAAVLLGRRDDDVETLIALIPKSGQFTKCNFHQRLLTMQNPKHRSALIELFAAPLACRTGLKKKFADADMTSEEYEGIEAALRLKAPDIRLEAIQLLLGRPPEGLYESIERLLKSKEEQKRLAGLDLIEQAEKLSKEKKAYAAILSACKALATENVAKTTKKSAAEEILVRKLAEKKAEYTRENGYGFCDPKGKIDFPAPKNAKRSLRKFLWDGIEPCKKILTELSALVHKHREFEYEGYQYSWETTCKQFVLGSADDLGYLTSDKEREARGDKTILLCDLPLAEVWEQFFADKKLKPEELLCLKFYLTNCISDHDVKWKLDFENMCCKPTEWFKKWYLDECCPLKELKQLPKFFEKIVYSNHIRSIVKGFANRKSSQSSQMAGLLGELLGTFYHSLPEEKLTERLARNPRRWYRDDDEKPTAFMGAASVLDFLIGEFYTAESDFEKRFRLMYKFYSATDYTKRNVGDGCFEEARELGLVDDTELYRELLCRPDREGIVRTITRTKDKDYLKYVHFRRLFTIAQDRLLDIELKRGDSPTDVSGLVSKIGYIEGIDYFIRILNALGKEPFTRGYMYGEKSRKDALCSLLKKCRPREADKIIGKTSPLAQFSEQRLLEAAMYVPEWIDIVQQHLGWKGLTSACWYFHAHINETMSEEKESVIARYSPITPQRFKDGAFDIEWFNDAHKTLGDKRFQMVYDAAKYITSGGNHRRAQIFADALRGKLKIGELHKSVSDKRNKDNLLAYSLLPLKKGKAGEKEQLERYAFLQNFLKESKKFGQQRKESEGKICEIALENLARAAGYDDVHRFIWAMETEKSKEYAKYFVPKKIDGFELSVTVDDFGKLAIRSIKEDGTTLKDVPSKLKKHAYVEELKEAVKMFRDQFRSVRANFEKAMEHETEFTAEELGNLSQNPVIRPIIEKLVYRLDRYFGFFTGGKLKDVDGKNGEKKLKPTDRLVIAHPVHLYEAKVWKAFQKIVFEREIVQPFKQVFRELYLPNADEKRAKTVSRRYAGHQVQPGKTVALLKSRNWTIDPDLGFQKVFYKLDVLIRLYCYADWLMPSQIEPPSIEQIEFVDRKTLEVIPLAKIPPVIFSEIMRDLDLVISVAHVGGVDPEASLSTVEMRGAIL